MTRHQFKIHNAACLMIERYGQTALHQVDQRIKELAEYGEHDTVELWRDVRTVVKQMLDNKKNGNTH